MIKYSSLNSIILIFLLLFFCSCLNNKPVTKYFSLNCSIFNSEAKIIFSKADHHCSFSSDGNLLVSRSLDAELSFYDKNDNLKWRSMEEAHHGPKFSSDYSRLQIISSEFFQYKDKYVKSDCFSIRDLNNKDIYKWCLKDHLSELELLGFDFTPKPVFGDKPKISNYPNYEISHGNSFYLIEKNARDSESSAFAQGNYIIHLHSPSGAVLILDSKLEKILWHLNLTQFNYDGIKSRLSAHDIQVTKEGNILAFVNYLDYINKDEIRKILRNYTLKLFSEETKHKFEFYDQSMNLFANYYWLSLKSKWYSQLIVFNPITQKIVWRHKQEPEESFKVDHWGSVNMLNNNHYLYNTTDYVVEIDQNGKEYIKMHNPFQPHDIRAKKPLQFVRSLDDMGFLKSRGLID